MGTSKCPVLAPYQGNVHLHRAPEYVWSSLFRETSSPKSSTNQHGKVRAVLVTSFSPTNPRRERPTTNLAN